MSDLKTLGEIRDALVAMQAASEQTRDYFLGLGLLETVNFDVGAGKLGTTGAALGTFADGASATPGTQITDSKALTVRWNNHATPTPIAFSWRLPDNMDRTQPWFVSMLASKTGDDVDDATTMTVAAFLQTAGELHDADSDMGGASNALEPEAAAKTVAELLFEFDPADLPETGDASVTFTVGPTADLLDTDDFVGHSLVIQYVRKAQA